MTERIDPSVLAKRGEADNPRLDRWLQRTTLPLDMLALCTVWLTLVPFASLHRSVGNPSWWFAARIGISFVYFVDMAVRTSFAHRKFHYVVTHPAGVFSVVLPAIRLMFSLRLLRSMFRKGNLLHFLGVALLLAANFTVIVYGFERTDPHSNITSLGIATWWAFVTVFTVGYGDYYPVTFGGRFFAVLLMALGLVVAAVITAQIASSFMDQAAARRAAREKAGEDPDGPSGAPDEAALVRIHALVERLESKLESIEEHLLHRTESPPATEGGAAGS